jgi:MFS transporter/cyclic nucleotide-binding protein
VRTALRHRDLRLLFGALVASATGSWAYNVALLAFVYQQTHSLGWVGAAGLGRFVPALLTSAYGGVIAERFERVRVMVCSDLLCVVWQGLLVVVAATDGSPTLAIALGALTSVSNVPYNPAVAATLPEIADEEELVAANALNGTIENLVVIAGPAVGAGLLALGNPAITFALNAGTFALSALLVSRMRARSRPSDVTEGGEAGPIAQMAAGALAIGSSSAVALLVAFCALVSFIYGTDTVLLVSASVEKLDTGPDGFGYLLAGLGVGGIVMAGVVDRLSARGRLAWLIIAGTAAYCLPTAVLTVVHEPVVAFVIEVVRGGGTLVVDVLAITALQRTVAQEMVARVFGVFFAIILGAISLGTVLTPPLVSAVGLDAALIIMAVAPTALALVGLPALLALDRAAVGRVAALAPRIAALEGLGIFAAARRPTLERLAAAAGPIAVRAGTAIVTEGEAADALYVITAGAFDVTSRGEGGDEPRHIRTMGPGSLFGEIGVLEGIPRTATVTAAGEGELLRISGAAFLEALTEAPQTGPLVEDARSRLARTHPTRRLTYEVPAAVATVEGG